MILRIITAVCTLLLVVPALAGPLDPPAGPIAPTPGPEPRIAINDVNTPGTANAVYRISQPGSYYLTRDLAGQAGKSGLVVQANGSVSIDLNGFSIVGVTGALDGIAVSGMPANSKFAIRDGSVVGWSSGVLTNVASVSVVVENVVCRGNIVGAVLNEAAVRNSDFSGNATSGLSIFRGLVTGCVAELNGASGFVSDLTEFRDCVSFDNGSAGYTSNGNSTFVNCIARSNETHGYVSGSGSAVFSGCVAEDNRQEGFRATSSNAAVTIRHCLARFNGDSGIRVVSGGVIEGNTLYNNGTPGAGAGILVVGSDNRIEGNNCVGADFGIKIDAGGNIVIRNSCSGNTTNWSIAIGNAVAPIVPATVNASPISGSLYAGSLGSTDPNANFTY